MQRARRCNLEIKAVGAVVILVAVGQVMAQAPDKGTAPDCKCRSPDGQMQDLGTVQCFDIVGRKNLLRCEMSTNTPFWKKVDGITGCPDA